MLMSSFSVFFFNDTATTEIYTLSLHDALPIYGGFFWINGDGGYPVPKDAYFMSGAGGQTTLIIPSYDLVVVRLGHYKGSEAGDKSFNQALALLMESVPRRK